MLSGAYTQDEWKPQLIDDVLVKLVPSNVRIMVIGQRFADIAVDTERWYGTKYKTEDIPKGKLEAWSQVEVSPSLHLPPRNEFIPTDFQQVERDPDGPSEYPEIIK